MNKLEMVFVPAPGIGHLVSTCEFAEKLLNRDERLCITVLIIMPPFDANTDAYIQRFSSVPEGGRIRYITLDQVEPPSPEERANSFENFLSLLIASYRPLVKDSIISNKWQDWNSKLIGIVVDVFCSSMIDVANELEVPCYLFCTDSAAFLGFLFYMSLWHEQVGREFNLSDSDLKIASYAHPVPIKALPRFAFNKDGYNSFRNHGVRIKETKGIFINTVSEFETHAVSTLTSDPELPPIYTVGPVIDFEGSKSEDYEEIKKWLDQQRQSSVLFLCFGSGGMFKHPQLREMAKAIEQSGVRFLWSIREPAEFDEILPEGFLERTKNRGMVCNWAPQVRILAHKATGAFVSHCGWNSTLESLWHGVPIVTWPLYAEQRMNAFQLVKDLEIAVELSLDYRMFSGDDDIVKAEEIKKAIRSVMDSENPVQKRVKDMAEICINASMEGGSSFISIGKFIETIANT